MSTSHHWYKTVTLCSQATASLAQQYQHSGIKLASEPAQKAMQTFSREMETVSRSLFPPGVRFRPTDEELIVYYLENKVNSRALPTCLIGEIELYNYDPWDLPNRALYGEDEWYFFTPRDRKYPNGVRPNRAAGSGFWKATGTDKPILNSFGTRIGVKKALVFYSGNAPNAVKTDWIMIEYRLLDTVRQPSRSEGSMRLDDWVLCRIKRKGNMSNNAYHQVQPTSSNLVEYLPRILELPSVPTGGNSTNICPGYFLPKECNLLAALLADQDLPRAVENIPGTSERSNIRKNLDADYENMPENAILTPNSSIFQDFFNSSEEKAKNAAGTSQSSNISKNFDADYENVPDNVILAPNSSISQNFFNSSNKKEKNVPGTSQSSNISKNFNADYEHVPDNAILAPNSSIFQDFFNSSDEKVMQEANTLYESIHQPTRWITAETHDKDFIISNEQPTTSAASFYDQYQSQGDVINFLP